MFFFENLTLCIGSEKVTKTKTTHVNAFSPEEKPDQDELIAMSVKQARPLVFSASDYLLKNAQKFRAPTALGAAGGIGRSVVL